MKGLVMKNVYVKYQKPTTYGSRDIIKVKDVVTDRQTNGRTDRQTNEI